MERNDYRLSAPEYEYEVYSTVLNRSFYGTTLSIAQANRDTAERVYYAHHAKDFYPAEH